MHSAAVHTRLGAQYAVHWLLEAGVLPPPLLPVSTAAHDAGNRDGHCTQNSLRVSLSEPECQLPPG